MKWCLRGIYQALPECGSDRGEAKLWIENGGARHGGGSPTILVSFSFVEQWPRNGCVLLVTQNT